MADSFDKDYYNIDYFVTPKGKKFTDENGKEYGWSYANQLGEWSGCGPIAKAWKKIFNPESVLDVGAGRGTFLAYMRDEGLNAVGFDFSEFAVSDEGRYIRCQRDWLIQHDATNSWPYADSSKDLVICLDLMEHIYENENQFVMDEIIRVSKKWIFLQIATTKDDEGYNLKKGQEIPMKFRGCAIAGHVNVRRPEYWIRKFMRNGVSFRNDKVEEFKNNVDSTIIANWLANTVLVLEKK